MDLPHANWNYPTTIWFGNGRLAELPAACAQLGMERPLLVTDRALVDLPPVQAALDALGEHPHTLYSDVKGNPTGANVEGGVARYKQQACDGVIALGGGSALDAGKAIAFHAGQRLPLWDFEDVGDNWSRADPDAIAPVCAIPTTAGTGSEVGRAAVILDEAARSKKIIFHPKMLPALVISDPTLCVGLPPTVTAWTGIDALVHAVEAYCAPGFHPMADAIAIEAIRMIAQYLPRAVARGDDLEARGQMLVAASMGATAFQKGLGSVHSVAHVLGALYDTHHGLANAVLLPYALQQNAAAIEARMKHLCLVLGLEGKGSAGFIRFVLDLRRRLEIPHSLADIGLDASRAVEIGSLAEADPSTPGNAMPVGAAELEQLFRAAVAGEFTAL